MILLAVSMTTLIIYALPHFSQIWVLVLLYLKFFVFWRGRGGGGRGDRKWVRMLVSYVPFRSQNQRPAPHSLRAPSFRWSCLPLGCVRLFSIYHCSFFRRWWGKWQFLHGALAWVVNVKSLFAVDIGVGVPVTYGWFVFHSRVYPHPTSLGDESSQPVENTSRRMQFSGHTKGLHKWVNLGWPFAHFSCKI